MRHNISRKFDHCRITNVQERQNPIEPQSHNRHLQGPPRAAPLPAPEQHEPPKGINESWLSHLMIMKRAKQNL